MARQKARLDAGTHVSPGQHGGNCGGHSIPSGVQRPEVLPVRETVCGLFIVLSLTESVPSRVPVVVAVKRTLIVQLAFDAKVKAGPQSLVSAKLVLMVIFAILSVPLPLLVNVTGWTALVVLKVKVVGDRTACGPEGRPSPVRETVCGLFFVLSVTESVPSRVPVVVGVKVTLNVQLAFDVKVGPQLLVSSK